MLFDFLRYWTNKVSWTQSKLVGLTTCHIPDFDYSFFRADLVENKFTDISLKSDIANIPGQKIHKLILAAQSPKMKQILLQMEHTAQEPEIVLADASKEVSSSNDIFMG